MNGMEFIVEHEQRIRRMIRVACRGNRAMLDDLWDEAMDRVPRLVDTLWDGERPLTPYVMHSLRWYIYKRIRALKNAPEPLLDETPVDDRCDEDTHDESEEVYNILSHVSAYDSMLIRMRVIEGMSFEKMGRKLGLLQPTVRKRFLAALNRLREAYVQS